MYGVGFPIFLFLFQMHKNNQFQKKEKEKTDTDTICGNKLLPVNQKARVTHFSYSRKQNNEKIVLWQV